MEQLLSFLLLLLRISAKLLLVPSQLYYQGESKCHIAAGEHNIILNPRFEDGLNNWSGKGCKIELHESLGDGKMNPQVGKFFASATERTEKWNGIEQEITGRVQQYLAYDVIALVRMYSGSVNTASVQVTFEQAMDTNWVQLKGEFLLNSFPSRAVIYLEGPPPGTDILINSLFVPRRSQLQLDQFPRLIKFLLSHIYAHTGHITKNYC